MKIRVKFLITLCVEIFNKNLQGVLGLNKFIFLNFSNRGPPFNNVTILIDAFVMEVM